LLNAWFGERFERKYVQIFGVHQHRRSLEELAR